jgi:hypothetical protein
MSAMCLTNTGYLQHICNMTSLTTYEQRQDLVTTQMATRAHGVGDDFYEHPKAIRAWAQVTIKLHRRYLHHKDDGLHMVLEARAISYHVHKQASPFKGQ